MSISCQSAAVNVLKWNKGIIGSCLRRLGCRYHGERSLTSSAAGNDAAGTASGPVEGGGSGGGAALHAAAEAALGEGPPPQG